MIDEQLVKKVVKKAKIYDVVSDHVQLSARGDHYVGLCPFHQSKLPGFYVYPHLNFCYCTSCKRGGSPLNFVMMAKNIGYDEAVRFLARKYDVELGDDDFGLPDFTIDDDAADKANDETKQILEYNKFASDFYRGQLLSTDEGRDIGLTYFQSRGFSEETMATFALGYSPDNAKALLQESERQGYDKSLMVKSGISPATGEGEGGMVRDVYDRYRNRVIFPVHDVNGNIVAFGGRVIKNVDHIKAKYVNSPETAVYHKSDQLYGLYQAKEAIMAEDKFFMVEGYTDVISMHQAGIKNVVASSGTALTEGQINLVKRFSLNATVLYDGDSAGINAAIRGIDMLLKAGLNIKVLLLPDGDDPDSFSKKHTKQEFHDYISIHETDFISFKTRVLLRDAAGDPIRRVEVIRSMVESIACIADDNRRNHYIRQCSADLQIDELILRKEVAKRIFANQEKETKRAAKEYSAQQQQATAPKLDKVEQFERAIVTYVVRYGMALQCRDRDFNNKSVIDYVLNEFAAQQLSFKNEKFARLFEVAKDISDNEFPEDFKHEYAEILQIRGAEYKEGLRKITGADVQTIQDAEKQLERTVNEAMFARVEEYRKMYMAMRLLNHADDEVRLLATRIFFNPNQLSKIHSKNKQVESEYQRLPKLIYNVIFGLSDQCMINETTELLAKLQTVTDPEEVKTLLQRLQEIKQNRSIIAQNLGERVITPSV